MDQKARTGKKLQVKKTVLKSLMDTKETLTCQDGTLVTNWILYINENVTDEQIAQSKKDLETAKRISSAWIQSSTLDNVENLEIYSISLTLCNNSNIQLSTLVL